jgi:L-rhamnose isomerase
MEEAKSLPFGPVWDHWCLSQGVPAGTAWIEKTVEYERNVLTKRK